jgi:Calcineurin-like phosphoesterase
LLCGCAHAPASALVFGLLGDTPYSQGEIERLDALIGDMNGERLDFVVHVGDIGSAKNACDDAWLDARKAQFARIRHNVVIVPGDNEWTDCRDQMGRLAAWRQRFCEVPLKVERQAGEFCEHLRWEAAGFLFVTLNVPGTNNNVRNTAEYSHRMAAVFAWLDESAKLARGRNLSLVLLMQANPFITLPRDGYSELRERLQQLGEKMAGRVVLVHGDTHTYHEDEPLPGMRRLEVWGSPIVSWVKADVKAGELHFGFPRYR